MFKFVQKILIIVFCGMVSFGMAMSAHAMDSDLVGLLTKSLSVTNQQAKGGAGAVFKAASKNMSAEDFTKVTDALPEVPSLMNAIPVSDAGSGSMGGLSSMLGKSGGSASSLAGLAGTFSQLGLGGGMVQKFIPIILDYAQNKGGKVVSGLLKTALQ
ncbi:MAG: hypothetical protein CR984_06685 [Proteobacteria bacterium]|nr:MAG: hypothetical protein CR984_06685 [Pseudomonadota bacterium]